MQITIRSVGGYHMSVDVRTEASLDELRSTIAAEMAIGPDVHLSLVLGERALPHTSGLALADFGIEGGATLTVIKCLAPKVLTVSYTKPRTRRMASMVSTHSNISRAALATSYGWI